MKRFYKINVTDKTQVSSPRVRRKRAARKEQILDCAMDLLATEGIDRLTVTRLAEELDYTAGALYRYFPSKDALLAEMQRKAIAELHRELSAAVEDVGEVEPADPAVAALVPLCALGERFLSLVDDRPQDVQLINFLLADPRNLIADSEVAITAALFARVLGEVESLLSAASNAGALSPGSARDRTVMLWTSLQSATQLAKMRRFDPARFEPRVVGGNLYRSLLRGWGADAEALARATNLVTTETRHASDPH